MDSQKKRVRPAKIDKQTQIKTGERQTKKNRQTVKNGQTAGRINLQTATDKTERQIIKDRNIEGEQD